MFINPRAPEETSSSQPAAPRKIHRRILLYFILGIALTPVVGFVAIYIFLMIGWQDSTPRGPLLNRSDWPIIVREWLDEMKVAGIDTSSTEIYLIQGLPGDYTETVMLRMDDNPQAMNFLQLKLVLSPIPANRFQHMIERATYQVPDTWWATSDPSVQYSASIRALSGEEADQYVVARDPKRSKIFVHYHFNF
jgi:hypothetical protein